MAKKYLNAVNQAKLHEEELNLVNDDLPLVLIHLWKVMIVTWEKDRSSPNPYYSPVKSMQAYISDSVSLTFGFRGL